MSFFPGKDPLLGDAASSDAIVQAIVPRTVDLGGFQVHRVLPSARQRMVGPFIFFDHMGPAVFRAGDGVDVRPHPHIGLSTVTYLFDGEIVHRDSLGTAMPIRPGAVNWMTAGRGIVHSERTAAERRSGGEPIHGLQLWVALPAKDEETVPAFGSVVEWAQHVGGSRNVGGDHLLVDRAERGPTFADKALDLVIIGIGFADRFFENRRIRRDAA